MEIKSDTIRSAVWKVSIFNISVLFGQSFNKWNESILPMYEGCALLCLLIKIELLKKKKKKKKKKKNKKKKTKKKK
jgi:membrane protein DedA with SNARE-associated domain